MTIETEPAFEVVDLEQTPLRELNARLHAAAEEPGSPRHWRVSNPGGRHAIAVGLNAPFEVDVEGHVGYYCAGKNQQAVVRVHGNCGVGVAENMMSGSVVVEGNASQSAGATGRGGLLVIRGVASSRCGISMKGVDIVVRGDVGSLGADCVQKELRDEHVQEVRALLESAGIADVNPEDIRRYGSARELYNFRVDDAGEF